MKKNAHLENYDRTFPVFVEQGDLFPEQQHSSIKQTSTNIDIEAS